MHGRYGEWMEPAQPHRPAPHASLMAALVATAVLLVSACSGDSAAPPAQDGARPDAPPVEERVRNHPHYDSASEEQLAILDDGEVTFEEYESAVARSLACMEDAGIAVQGPRKVEDRGFTELNYSHSASSPGRTDEETLAVSDACLHEHSMIVELIYQTSPTAVESQDELFEQTRESTITCVNEHGGDLDSDATRDEVQRSAAELLANQRVNCLNLGDN